MKLGLYVLKVASRDQATWKGLKASNKTFVWDLFPLKWDMGFIRRFLVLRLGHGNIYMEGGRDLVLRP